MPKSIILHVNTKVLTSELVHKTLHSFILCVANENRVAFGYSPRSCQIKLDEL